MKTKKLNIYLILRKKKKKKIILSNRKYKTKIDSIILYK